MSLFFFVNGQRVDVPYFTADETLASYLREQLQLTGCKLGCGVGVCGACTVMLSRLDAAGRPVHEAVNACLLPLPACHAKAVLTIEALGSARTRLQPLQRALAEGHGVQCGFCSPGLVMSAYALVRNSAVANVPVQPSDLTQALRGNLCRCTGYRPAVCALETACCAVLGSGEGSPETSSALGKSLDSSQELLFPPALAARLAKPASDPKPSLCLSGAELEWLEPADEAAAVKALASRPDAVLLGGNGLRTLGREATRVVSLAALAGLAFDTAELELRIGGGLTLTALERGLKQWKAEGNTGLRQTVVEMTAMLAGHASAQVKAVATVGGSVGAFRRYPHFALMLAALEATLDVVDRTKGDRREVAVTEAVADPARFAVLGVRVGLRRLKRLRLFRLRGTGASQCALCAAALGSAVSVAVTFDARKGQGYCVRRLQASAVEAERPTALALLIGQVDAADSYSRSLFCAWLQAFCSTNPVTSGGSIHASGGPGATPAPEATLSMEGGVGAAAVGADALAATAGELEFVDDVPVTVGELHLGLVSSTQAHARLVSVDPWPALKLPGVVAYIGAADVPCNSVLACVPPADEEVFAAEEVHFVGQTIGAVVARNRRLAWDAARLVIVEYSPLPAVHSIEEALEQRLFHRSSFCVDAEAVLTRGDAGKALGSTFEGAVCVGDQEHFYLEPHSALARPSSDRMLILASTHGPGDVQRCVAAALAMPLHRVEVQVPRLGGSFGGKETRAIVAALPAAVAAAKMRRPVRCVLPRDVDFRLSGGRHPLLGKYSVTVDAGRLSAVMLDLSLDGGAWNDVSTLVRNHCLLKVQSGYRVPSCRYTARACKTNRTPSTAFRGFGGPQAMMVMEMAMEHAAEELGICPDRFREDNLVGIGDTDAFGNPIKEDHLRQCWIACKARGDYEKRKTEIAAFNKTLSDVRRGIAIVPVMFGIGFDAPFLNQASAQLLVYASDASLLLSHGGVEMGQGIEVKMRQIVATSTGLPLDLIRTQAFSTALVANASPTASSATTDLVGRAVMDACEKLKERLGWKPIEGEAMEGRLKRWKGQVSGAYFAKIDLNVRGHFAHPCPGVTPAEGGKFFYYTYGAGCSEVELDTATGEYQILRTDIVMDVGKSINPGIDIGQIEGAFMQGYGLFCKERMDDARADLSARVVHDYPLPRVDDVPAIFNVHLLRNVENNVEHAVYSSKGIGEPPLFLGSSVYFAMRRAVKAMHGDRESLFRRIDCPATSDRVRSTIDKIVESVNH